MVGPIHNYVVFLTELRIACNTKHEAKYTRAEVLDSIISDRQPQLAENKRRQRLQGSNQQLFSCSASLHRRLHRMIINHR